MASDHRQTLVGKLLSEFSSLTKAPENFLKVQNTAVKKVKTSTKKLYDLAKSEEGDDRDKSSAALPELIIDHFDDEQIWQELELQNNSLIAGCVSQIARLVTAKNSTSFHVQDTIESSLHVDNDVDEADSEEDDDVGEKDENDEAEEDDDEEEDDLLMGDDAAASDSDAELDRLLDEDARLRLSETQKDEEEADSESDPEVSFNFDLSQTKDDADTEPSGKKGKRKQTKSTSQHTAKTKRKTVVDDAFFKLADMEAFLDQEDAKEERLQNQDEDAEDDSDGSDDEDINMFEDIPSDEEDEDVQEMKYTDFFDPPDNENDTEDENAEDDEGVLEKNKKKRVSFKQDSNEHDEDSDNSEEDGSDDNTGTKRHLLTDSESEGEDVADILGSHAEKKSSFEKRQERLKQRIDEFESAALEEKPWQLSGEIGAAERPENSLLQEHLNFDHMTRQAPVITEDTTKSLEELIKQRIKDKAFDDVERKIKPKDEPYEYKKRIVLDQEKSKLSLGEVYEQEYMKQAKQEEEEILNAEHEDIKKMMSSLFVKLDALCNFHYTPKPAAAEVKIVSNLPSINMEEVAPVSASDAAMLAPEEIMEKQKGELKGTTEKTDTDKKRERREKKMRKRIKQKEREKKQQALEKQKPGVADKRSKVKALEKLEKQSKSSKSLTIIKDKENSGKSNVKSSSAFFTKLQEEVTSQISSKKASKKKDDKKPKTATKFKL